jgi:hypothetical protein
VLAVATIAGAAHAQRFTDKLPLLSPRGDRIAFWRYTDGARLWSLMVMRADGTRVRRIASAHGPGAFGWSPDEKLIAYTDREIWVVPSSGGRARRLTHDVPDKADSLYFDHWIDNSTIGYFDTICCTDGLPEDFPAEVDVHKHPPKATAPPVDCPGDDCALAPNGRRIAWDEWNAQTQSSTVYTADADGSGRVSVGHGWYPKWSPDSTRLAYAAGDGPSTAPGAVAIAPADAPGSTVVSPTTTSIDALAFAWQPGGSVLAFVLGDQLWTVDESAPAAHPVRGARESATVGDIWSPHGRWLLLPVSPTPRSLVLDVLRPDGSDRHQVLAWRLRSDRRGNFLADAFFSLSWSAGDRSLVYYDLLPPHCVPAFAIYRAEVATGRTRRLTNVCR